MQTKKLLLGVLVVALLAGGAYVYTNGSLLQGKFGGPSTSKVKPDLTVTSITEEDGKLAVVVKNSGSGNVSAGAAGHTYIYINDLSDAKWKYSWTTLSDKAFFIAGGKSTINPEILSDGSYEIKACVDATLVVVEKSETNNCLTQTVNVGNYLTMDISAGTPREDIVVAGSKYFEMTEFELTAMGDSFVVDELAVWNRYDSTIGDADNNLTVVYLEYEDMDGSTILNSAYPVNSEIPFSGLDLYVPMDDSVKVKIYADINDISSSGSSATAGELVELNPTMDGLKAVAQTSGSVFTGSGSTLTQANVMHVYESRPTFSLSSSSPSGTTARAVSATDSVFIFDVTADANEDVTIRDLEIQMSSDADFATSASVTATLRDTDTGDVVGSGAVSFTSTSKGSVTFSDDFEIERGETRTLELVLDTATLLDEDSGDDPLVFGIGYGSSSDGVVTPGGVVWYETNKEVEWLGYNTTSSLSGNTLRY